MCNKCKMHILLAAGKEIRSIANQLIVGNRYTWNSKFRAQIYLTINSIGRKLQSIAPSIILCTCGCPNVRVPVLVRYNAGFAPKYSDLAKNLIVMKEWLKWKNGRLCLKNCTKYTQALAVITCVCEVGRGYSAKMIYQTIKNWAVFQDPRYLTLSTFANPEFNSFPHYRLAMSNETDKERYNNYFYDNYIDTDKNYFCDCHNYKNEIYFSDRCD